MDELEAWLIFARVPGLHAGVFKRALRELGSIAQLAGGSESALRQAGLTGKQIAALARPDADKLRADQTWLAQSNRALVPFGSENYPRLLTEIEDAPLALFVRGDVSVLDEPQLAIVGSRNPTPSGRETAHSFAQHLAGHGLAITSGLALGIDTASHRGALAASGRTIAVCGTGLDIDYPRSNAELSREIELRGALVSEFPPGTPPLKINFPRRNRLISALSLGTLVVEAAVQSGSLITARLAGDQGREVFAIPGSIHNPLARGCHQLIRQGAKLVENANDVLSELGMPTTTIVEPARGKSRDTLDTSARAMDKEYEILLDAFGFDPVSVDQLIERSGFKADSVASMLLILELEEQVEAYPGGLYVRARSRR
jgi:DNA processing protein